MRFIKRTKILAVLLFAISMSSISASSKEGNSTSVKEYQTKNGVLLSIKSNDSLYDKYLELSSEMDRLDIKVENNELEYFIVTDESAKKEMVVVKGEQHTLVLNYDIDSKLIPYKLLIEEAQITQAQYEAIVESLS